MHRIQSWNEWIVIPFNFLCQQHRRLLRVKIRRKKNVFETRSFHFSLDRDTFLCRVYIVRILRGIIWSAAVRTQNWMLMCFGSIFNRFLHTQNVVHELNNNNNNNKHNHGHDREMLATPASISIESKKLCRYVEWRQWFKNRYYPIKIRKLMMSMPICKLYIQNKHRIFFPRFAAIKIAISIKSKLKKQ